MCAFRRLFAVWFSALMGLTAVAQAQAPEHELKAAFVFNFIQFTQWPEAALPAEHLTLCASPGSAFTRALQTLKGKAVHNRTVRIVPLAEARSGECEIIVITQADRSLLPTVKRLTGSTPVLTITDDTDLAREGILITLQLEAGRVTFSIDNTRANDSGLTLSSRLLRLARSVR